jgi:kynurenine formamidase
VRPWLCLLLLLFACDGAGEEPARTGGPADALADLRVVDLTHALGPNVPVFPGGERFASENLARVETDGYFDNRFRTGEHTGTHVDAPAHFAAGGATVDAIAPEALVARIALIDIRERVAVDPDSSLAAADVLGWEQRHGRLGTAHVVLVRTGWGARWPDEARYRNADAAGVMHFPGVSVEASALLRARGVRAIGVDTLSMDPGRSTGFEEHRDFLAAGGYHLENLANLAELPETGAILVVGVLPIAGGSGAPARILALVPGRAVP